MVSQDDFFQQKVGVEKYIGDRESLIYVNFYFLMTESEDVRNKWFTPKTDPTRALLSSVQLVGLSILE